MQDARAFLSEGNPLALFDITQQLAVGSYGIVYKAIYVPTKEVVALKIIKIEEDEDVGKMLFEVKIMAQCKHKNIVKYIGAWLKGDELFIAMELCQGGTVQDLYQVLEAPLSEDQMRWIAHGALESLVYLHAQLNIIHRDLKAANLLLMEDGQVKLTDFGVSAVRKTANEKRKSLIGSPHWMAPEVCKTQLYDEKADIWSLGMVMIEMAEMKMPLAGTPALQVLMKMQFGFLPRLKNTSAWSKSFVDFVHSMLQVDANKRPSAATLLKHEFLKDVTKSPPQSLLDGLKALKALEEDGETQEDIPSSTSTASNNQNTTSSSPTASVVPPVTQTPQTTQQKSESSSVTQQPDSVPPSPTSSSTSISRQEEIPPTGASTSAASSTTSEPTAGDTLRDSGTLSSSSKGGSPARLTSVGKWLGKSPHAVAHKPANSSPLAESTLRASSGSIPPPVSATPPLPDPIPTSSRKESKGAPVISSVSAVSDTVPPLSSARLTESASSASISSSSSFSSSSAVVTAASSSSSVPLSSRSVTEKPLSTTTPQESTSSHAIYTSAQPSTNFQELLLTVPVTELMSVIEKRSAEVLSVFEADPERKRLWEKSLFAVSSSSTSATSVSSTTSTATAPRASSPASKIQEMTRKRAESLVTTVKRRSNFTPAEMAMGAKRDSNSALELNSNSAARTRRPAAKDSASKQLEVEQKILVKSQMKQLAKMLASHSKDQEKLRSVLSESLSSLPSKLASQSSDLRTKHNSELQKDSEQNRLELEDFQKKQLFNSKIKAVLQPVVGSSTVAESRHAFQMALETSLKASQSLQESHRRAVEIKFEHAKKRLTLLAKQLNQIHQLDVLFLAEEFNAKNDNIVAESILIRDEETQRHKFMLEQRSAQQQLILKEKMIHVKEKVSDKNERNQKKKEFEEEQRLEDESVVKEMESALQNRLAEISKEQHKQQRVLSDEYMNRYKALAVKHKESSANAAATFWKLIDEALAEYLSDRMTMGGQFESDLQTNCLQRLAKDIGAIQKSCSGANMEKAINERQAEQERWLDEIKQKLLLQPKEIDTQYLLTARDALKGTDRELLNAAEAQSKSPKVVIEFLEEMKRLLMPRTPSEIELFKQGIRQQYEQQKQEMEAKLTHQNSSVGTNSGASPQKERMQEENKKLSRTTSFSGASPLKQRNSSTGVTLAGLRGSKIGSHHPPQPTSVASSAASSSPTPSAAAAPFPPVSVEKTESVPAPLMSPTAAAKDSKKSSSDSPRRRDKEKKEKKSKKGDSPRSGEKKEKKEKKEKREHPLKNSSTAD